MQDDKSTGPSNTVVVLIVMGRLSQVISFAEVKTVALTKIVGGWESANNRNGVKEEIFMMRMSFFISLLLFFLVFVCAFSLLLLFLLLFLFLFCYRRNFFVL